MLALQIVFCASFQPVDLAFYVNSKVINHLAQISIMLELAIVSSKNHHDSGLNTCCSTLSSLRASTTNNEPHKK